MSTSTKVTAPKPKRPLSGYNLFYRYKRIKVLEATARPDGRCPDGHGRDDEAVIREVLAAVPGLEGVSPLSPIFATSPARLNEFRATAIRAAMEGQLLPNENARKRVHKKVLGVGFVEMGRMMRQAWGQADKFTKGLFCELADVGRARYKRLVAEYKLGNDRPEDVKPSSASLRKWRESRAASFAAASSPVPRRAPSSSDPVPEAPSARATGSGPAAASSESRDSVRASANLHVRAPETSDRPSQGRRASAPAELHCCDVSLFEPLPVGRATSRVASSALEHPTAKTGGNSATRPEASHGHGRRVSPSPAAFATGDGGAGSDSTNADPEGSKTDLKDLQRQKIFLKNAIKKIKDKIVRNNSLLPTDMQVFPKEDVVPRDRVVGEKARLEITTSSGSSAPTAARNSDAPIGGAGGGGSKKGEASARDFAEFVDDFAEFMDKMDQHR